MFRKSISTTAGAGSSADILLEKAVHLYALNDIEGAIRLAEINLELVLTDARLSKQYCQWLLKAERLPPVAFLRLLLKYFLGEVEIQRPAYLPLEHSNVGCVVLVAPNPRARSWKIAHTIKAFGAKVIYIHPSDYQPKSDDPFDLSISYGSLKELHATIERLEDDGQPDLYHMFCDSWGYVEAIMLMNQVAAPVVLDYYDLTNIAYDADLRPEYRLSMLLERWCIAHADGICARNLEIQVAKRQGFSIESSNNIFFPEYCYDSIPRRKKLGDVDGRLHIFISEPISDPGIDLNAPNSQRPLIEFFKGNDNFRIYLYPSQGIGSDAAERFPGYIKLADEQQNFEFRPMKSEKDYLKEVSQFDVLVRNNNMFNPNFDVTSLEPFSKGHYSNCFADCLDTNTLYCCADGRIAFSEHRGVLAWLVDRFGAGMLPAREDALKIEYWEALRQKLRSTPLDLSKARKHWSLSTQSGRLIKFYQECLARQSEIQPELSIVCTARNDDHGGNLLKRMRLWFNCILTLAERHKLKCELILVDWNPPDGEPKLHEVLPWPEEHKYCSIRIIEVPNSIHQRYKHSKSLPLYQMIAKNVGIRRARGRMVLSTNVDILFTDALFEFFASGRMDEGKMYRVDRYDTDGDIRETDSIDEQLATARDTILRVGYRGGTLNYRSGHYDLIYCTFADDALYDYKHNWRYPLHTNASGDFALLSRKNWFEIGGYWETDAYSFHLDSILCYTAHFAGIIEEYLPSPMWVHHIEHDSGWTPEFEQAGTLEKRLSSAGIPKISDRELEGLYILMAEHSRPIKCSNGVNWGHADDQLTEQVMCRADWDSQENPLRTAISSPPLPPLPLLGESSRLSDALDQFDSINDHYVSFIYSVCKDDNNLGVTQQVQSLIDRLAKQCETYCLNAELFLVEWKPNFDGRGLTETLIAPSGTNLDLRVISIPETDRRQLRNAGTIRQLDIIGYNVAARRARGKFLLFAPVEVSFSDQLIQFLSLRRLNPDCLYGVCEEDLEKNEVDNIEQLSDEELEEYFFTMTNKNSIGVFELISKKRWVVFRGYPEVPASPDEIAPILQCMAKAAGMTVVGFRQSLVFSNSVKKKTHEPADGIFPSLDYEKEIVPWCNMMKRDKVLTTPNQEDWGFGDRQYKIFDVKSSNWLHDDSRHTEVSPSPLYSSSPDDEFQEMIDQISRGLGNPFFQEISAKSLRVLETFVKSANPQKVIEFGSGAGLSLRCFLRASRKLEVVAVGDSHAELRNSSQYLPIDFSRVSLVETNPWKVSQTDLWNVGERVVLFFNLNNLNGCGDVFEIFERLIPGLDERDVVVVNGLWHSPIELQRRNVEPYFSNQVIQDINPLEPDEYYFASYWKAGSYFGAGDITNLVDWFNLQQVDVRSPSGTSLVEFYAPNGLTNNPPICARKSQSETGSFFYNPANCWVRLETEDEPLGRRINSLCKLGASEYKGGNFEAAYNYFGEAYLMGERERHSKIPNFLKAKEHFESGDLESALALLKVWEVEVGKTLIGPERILMACQINLGNIEKALELASTSFENYRVGGEMLNRIRRFCINTDEKYTVREVKET